MLSLSLSETTIARNWTRSDTRQLRFKLPHYKLLKNCRAESLLFV